MPLFEPFRNRVLLDTHLSKQGEKTLKLCIRELSAGVEAGDADFRIESYGIFVSQILGTFLFCSK